MTHQAVPVELASATRSPFLEGVIERPVRVMVLPLSAASEEGAAASTDELFVEVDPTEPGPFRMIVEPAFAALSVRESLA